MGQMEKTVLVASTDEPVLHEGKAFQGVLRVAVSDGDGN